MQTKTEIKEQVAEIVNDMAKSVYDFSKEAKKTTKHASDETVKYIKEHPYLSKTVVITAGLIGIFMLAKSLPKKNKKQKK